MLCVPAKTMKLYSFLWKNISPVSPIKPKTIETISHVPVLAREITDILSPKDGQCFLDMTFGGGGHTKYLLSTNRKITIFALDRDPEAFERAIILSKKLSQQNNGQKIVPLLGRFSHLKDLLQKLRVPHHSFDGAIIDLGASNYQYENGQRGFSFRLDGPLDMRMDGYKNPNMPSAADVINSLGAEDLTKIFKVYGEEKNAARIAQAIVDSRFMMKRLNTTRELAELVATVIENRNNYKDKLGRSAHPATKIFQSLRIFVNNELNELNYAIQVLGQYLKLDQSPNVNENELITDHRTNGGLLAIISFHSLEDKIVKSHFANQYSTLQPKTDDYAFDISRGNAKKIWKFYRKKLIVPDEDEVLQNPRSRSAKLRVGIRIAENLM